MTAHNIYIACELDANESQSKIGLMIFDEFGEYINQESRYIAKPTSNMRLSLEALYNALEYAVDGDVIFSDIDYCVKGYNNWLDSWIKKGWRTANKKPVQNRDLWQMIDELRSSKYVEVERPERDSDEMEQAKALALPY